MKLDSLSPEIMEHVDYRLSMKSNLLGVFCNASYQNGGFNTFNFRVNDVQVTHSSQDKIKHFFHANIKDHYTLLEADHPSLCCQRGAGVVLTSEMSNYSWKTK